MKNIAISFLVIFSYQGLTGSEGHSYIDSLKKVIYSETLPDSSFFSKANQYIFQNYRPTPDTFYYYANILLKKAIETKDTNNIARTLLTIGSIQAHKGLYENSIKTYNESFHLYKKMNNEKKQAYIYNSLGLVFLNQGNYSKSLEYFLNSLKVREVIGNEMDISITHNNIALVYMQLENYDRALEYHFQNIIIREKWEDKSFLGNTYTNIGNVYKRMGNYQEALSYYLKDKKIKEALSDKEGLSRNLLNIANIYIELDRFEEAESYYFKSLNLKLQIKSKLGELLVYRGLGYLYSRQKKYGKSIEYFRKNLALTKEIGATGEEMDAYENLYAVYEAMGNTSKAFSYYKQFTVLKDSLFNMEKAKQITEIQEKYESEKKEQQIALLEKENELRKLEVDKSYAEIEKRNLQRNILIGGMLLFIGFSIYLILIYRRNRKLSESLTIQKKEVERQNQFIEYKNTELEKVNSTKDKLFQIIAHDLRSPLISIDSIAKLIPMFVKADKSEQLPEIICELNVSISRVLGLVDNLLQWALAQTGSIKYRPEELDLYFQASKNLETFESLAAQKDIELENTIDRSLKVYADRNLLDTVFRNLINNALKFTGEKGKITIGAEKNNGTTKVWLKDSGIGIEPEKLETLFQIVEKKSKPGTKGERGSGLGLLLCKEFVLLNKGEIRVESELHKGTIFSFTVPSAEPVG